ncbi:HAD family hydrolase [Cellulosilyticum sp. I15G10I2]|uniref:HAD family hydrolase n=1 Tax=Cellulosilyticum sp. I15G10I2 TaxID=1892843 RepID=UPI00085CA820|nr:HAD family phosphatase [Cellulosilyticum sp. I15G10I2]
MLKGIIFDMDGVLVNSEPMHYKAYCLALEKYNIVYPYEIYKNYIGSTQEKILEDIRSKNSSLCANEEFIKEYNTKKDFLIESDGFEVIPGIPALIRSLHAAGYQLAVASSSPYAYIIRVTKALGIYPYFHKIVSGADVPHPKPAPDVFFKAVEELELTPSECIIIEDSTNGVRAAQAAGIPCIGFYNPDSGDQNLKEAAIIIESFETLDAAFIEKVYQAHTK